jgi:hypothetical protein
MKRLFPTSLALLLVMGSLSNLFAAAFCPRMLGRDCCLAKTTNNPHGTHCHQHVQSMTMHAIAEETMSMNGVEIHGGMAMAEDSMSTSDGDMTGMTMAGPDAPPSNRASDETFVAFNSQELASENKVDLPMDACPHCASHSGMQNAPVSSVSVPNRSDKDPGSVLLPVSRFLSQRAMSSSQIGLPREHAPPGNLVPRYILIGVFLI